jgi:hypothetical protein
MVQNTKTLRDCFSDISVPIESLASLTAEEFESVKPELMAAVDGKRFKANLTARNYQIKDLYQISYGEKKITRMYVGQPMAVHKGKGYFEHFWMTLPLHLKDKDLTYKPHL